MKKVILSAVLILSLIICSSCGKSSDASCRSVLSDVTKEFNDEFDTITSYGESLYEDSFGNMYGVQFNMINDGAICYLDEGNSASEVSILHLKKSEDVNVTKLKLEDRVASRRNTFAGYLPEEVSKIDNYEIIVQGNFVCLIIAKDPAMVESVIRAAISKGE